MTDSVSNSFNGDNHGRFAQARDVGQLVFNAGPATTKALAALPATTTRFLGRDQELQQLRLAWSRPGLSVVASGLAGIGKTELVLHAAHAAVTAGEFPGGVLFIDLQGYDNARLVSASHALDNFLRALGVNGSDIPPEVDQRAQLFRSMLTEQERMLIVLDNASSADQVNPLLPGTPQHQVVISSRHRLSSLDNAQHLEIDSLGQAAAEELVGGSAELARLCGRLPLALRIIAALREDEPETDWVAELADARDRLELLDDGDSRAVHAAFDLSYSTLTPEQQRFFRLLAAHPGDEVEVDSATVLADLSLSQTRRLFRELRRAHLVEANGPGWYGLHDLVRLYARRRLHDGHQHEQVSALHRVLQHYTTKAEAADAVFKALASADYDQPEMLGTAATLMEWLERRRPILVAAVSAAATAGRDRTVCRLTKALNYLFDYGRHHLEWFTVFELGLSSARKLGDEPYEGFFLRVRGYVLGRLMRYDEAIQESRQGLEISRALNDHFHSAWTLRDIAKNLTRLGRYEEAREFAQEALSTCRAHDDHVGTARSLILFGYLHELTGEISAALHANEEARLIYHDLGNRAYEADAHVHIATCLQHLGDHEKALEHSRHAVHLLHGFPNIHLNGTAHQVLAAACHALGKTSEAMESLTIALSMFEKTGEAASATAVRQLIAKLSTR